MPIIFYVYGAGCCKTPTFRNRTVGNDQDEGTFEDEGPHNTPANITRACLFAGYIRELRPGDDLRSKHRSEGCNWEYTRDSDVGEWEIVHKYHSRETLRYVEEVFMAQFPGSLSWEVAVRLQSNDGKDYVAFATFEGEPLLDLRNSKPCRDGFAHEVAASDAEETSETESNKERSESSSDEGSEKILLNRRVMGGPTAAKDMLAPDSSDENDGEPSEREKQLEVEEEH